jgi:hypothetical protein
MARARTAALLACAALLMAAASALTFQVEPQSEECVYEDIEAGRTFKMNFEGAYATARRARRLGDSRDARSHSRRAAGHPVPRVFAQEPRGL